MKIILSLIFSLLVICNFYPQTDEYIFKQLTDADGLSQSTIFATIQDDEGYLWFGTIDGLNRYDGYEFRVYSNDPMDPNSISDNFISCLFEDKDGYIWIGTINGYLNKFDKNTENFKRYFINDFFQFTEKPDPAYYDYPLAFSRNQVNSVTSIVEDSSGWLWIGTWANGIVRFNKNNGKGDHIFHNPNSEGSLGSNRITDIIFDKQNDLWISTFGHGIVKFEFGKYQNGTHQSNQYKFTNYYYDKNNLSGLNDDNIISLFDDRDGNLWIGTYNGGLNLLDKKNKQLQPKEAEFRHFTANKNCGECLCNNTVMAIEQDFENYLWIGTFGGGLDRFDFTTETFSHINSSAENSSILQDNEILSLFVDRSGIIWVGSHLGEGVTKLQKSYAKFQIINRKSSNPFKLNDDVVWSIYRDSKNNLWIGTYRGGLNFLNFETGEIKTLTNQPGNPNSLNNNHIRSIAEDNFGNIWIGTYSGGLNRYNPFTNKFTVFQNEPNNSNSLSANQVLDIFVETEKIIWVATFGGGLNRLTFTGNSSENNPSFTHYKNDPSNSFSISDNRVYVIHKNKKNDFWVGTYGAGINKFDPISGKFHLSFEKRTENRILNNAKILSMLEDSNGQLWIGTSGDGLFCLDEETNKVSHFSRNEGLTSSVVYGILEDNNGNLWMSSDDGIFVYNKRSKNFTQFVIEDGLQSLEFSGGAYYKDKNGLMFFGGINGVNFFNPEEIIIRNYIPPVSISGVSIFNQRVNGNFKELILSYDQNFISFEFTALDFSNPDRNKYSYILEGFDEVWQFTDASRRTAYYTNLPAGKYNFRVIGSNPDGIWNETGSMITLIINPPFWQTWWFVTLIVIIIGFLIYYTSTIRIKNQLAMERLKTKIASDLHDNVGSGLTEISILSEVANQKLNHSPGILSSELKNISEIARQLVDNMSDIVWVVNPGRDSLYDLIIKLKDSYNEFLNSVGISFQVKNIDKTNDVHLPMDFKQNLLLMFKEAINNSMKHSRCTKIILEASINNESVTLSLMDDGTGFDKNVIKSGNGMRNIELRAQKIGGYIELESSPGKGTKVIFKGKINKLFKLKSLLSNQ